MRAEFLCLIACLTLPEPASVAAGPPEAGARPTADPYARVRMARARYVAGEPIGITVSIANPGPEAIDLEFHPPYPFAFFGRDSNFYTGPLRLAAVRGPLIRRPPQRFLGGTGPGPLEGTTALRTGMTWAATTFLQTYFEQPGPGSYEMEYQFRMPYLVEAGRSAVFASGVLHFEVIPAEPGELRRVMDGYWRQAEHPDPPEQVAIDWAYAILKPILDKEFPDTTRYKVAEALLGWLDELSGWVNLLRPEGESELREREAIAALSAVEDPVAIPYLVRVIESTTEPWLGFEALERFRRDERARRALIGLLKTKHAWEARRWLEDPRTGLGVDELERILKGNP